MRKILCAVVLLCLMAGGASAAVQINDTNFPDPLFRFYITADCDTNNDGILSDEEIFAVKSFIKPHFTGNNGTIKMYSMKGVEYLTELVSIDCRENPLSSLDVSKNTKLRYLECKDCETLSSLNVSGLSELRYLDCDTNSLDVLDLTGCANLVELHCAINSLQELDISGNAKLVKIDCWANYLSQLDISSHIYLVSVDCNMNYIESLNASGCTSLKYLHSPNNHLSSLNISGCNNLLEVDINGNWMKEINLSGNNSLESLDCGVNMLVSLDVSGCTKLTGLDCSDNRLKYINLSGCSGLRTLSCNNNQLEGIDVSASANLVRLYCESNRLAGLDVSKNYMLESLRCGNNYITAINLANNTKLKELAIRYNNLAELNLSGNTQLYSGHVSADNQTLSGLNVASQTGGEYPFTLDFGGYVSSGNLNNIIASSVKGFAEDSSEIETVYSGGAASFRDKPSRVRYFYGTGINGGSMDVTIGDSDFLSLALNGHVYRVFNQASNWENARDYCKSLGGDLAVITADDEKELLRELITKARLAGAGTSEGYWLGAEMTSNDKWLWINGEDFTDTVSPVYTVSRRIPITRVIKSGSETSTELIREVIRNYPEGVYLQSGEDGKFIGWHDRHPSGFICEWDSVSTDSAPYSDEYLRYISADKTSMDYGYIPSPVDYKRINTYLPQATATGLPAKYDPRNEGITLRIGDQNPYGTCWAFAAIGALEASYVAQGYGRTAPDISESHMAWFTYMDPRPGYSKPLNKPQNNLLTQGGSTDDSISFLSRMGTATVAEAPYPPNDLLPMNDNQLKAFVASNFRYKYPDQYSNPVRLKAAYQLDDVKTQRQRAKQLIHDYGAVVIGFRIFGEYMSSNGENYYMPNMNSVPRNKGGYHAIILVGWDDNYSGSNFRSNANPNGTNTNGAWLAVNSYGTSFGNGGFFWISYAQETYDCAAFVASDSQADRPLANDTLAADITIPQKWSANIFKAEDSETLNEVSFLTRAIDTHYEVYVNKLGTSDPQHGPGIPQGSPVKTGTLEYAGYHVVELDNPIELNKGEYFAVMLKLSSQNTEDGYITAVSENNSYVGASSVQAGKSWFAYSDSIQKSTDWQDGSRLKFSNGTFSLTASVKAFTSDNGPVKISVSSLPSGTAGQSYSCILTASGARPITWTVTGLPDGLTHNNGRISGTPTEAGTYSIRISAQNSKGTDSKNLSLVISDIASPAGITITTTSLPSGYLGVRYSANLSANVSGVTWSVESGSLPAGLTLSSSGTISGTPTATGTSTFTVKAVSGTRSATKLLSITISTSQYDDPTQEPGTIGSSGGGGCNSGSIAGIISAIFIMTAIKKRNQ